MLTGKMVTICRSRVDPGETPSSNRSSRSNRSNPLLKSPPRRGGGDRWGLERSAAVERLEQFERLSKQRRITFGAEGSALDRFSHLNNPASISAFFRKKGDSNAFRKQIGDHHRRRRKNRQSVCYR